ncbi:MAG: ABC transporter ATP-binding protein [Planctomycetaceae bacterium]
MIEFDSVTRLYGKVLGVNDISMSLPPGAYGLLGPNGAGKSTMLNLLTGQLRPTRGTVHVLGENPRNNHSLMKRIGYCPSFEGMYSGVKGLDWVIFLLRMHGYQAAEARARAMSALDRVGMTHAMRRPISGYSRGMRQRTKLAQAIAHDPELLILDEPLSGLDPVGRAQMTELLREWIDRGRSIVIASHVLHEIEALTESFLLISGGRLLASGTASEVYELLFNVPMEMHIRCDKPRVLAGMLVQHDLADSTRISLNDAGQDVLILQTRATGKLASTLPQWVRENDLTIFEMRTADDSLQSLFNSLMKIHRGEL